MLTGSVWIDRMSPERPHVFTWGLVALLLAWNMTCVFEQRILVSVLDFDVLDANDDLGGAVFPFRSAHSLFRIRCRHTDTDMYNLHISIYIYAYVYVDIISSVHVYTCIHVYTGTLSTRLHDRDRPAQTWAAWIRSPASLVRRSCWCVCGMYERQEFFCWVLRFTVCASVLTST